MLLYFDLRIVWYSILLNFNVYLFLDGNIFYDFFFVFLGKGYFFLYYI